MKKIGVIIIIIALIITVAWYFSSSKLNGSVKENCVAAGEDKLGYPYTKSPKICCENLKEISAAKEDQYQIIDGKFFPAPGIGSICSDCGNAICEKWENKYNCQEYCK